jgi:hypothetical protein
MEGLQRRVTDLLRGCTDETMCVTCISTALEADPLDTRQAVAALAELYRIRDATRCSRCASLTGFNRVVGWLDWPAEQHRAA